MSPLAVTVPILLGLTAAAFMLRPLSLPGKKSLALVLAFPLGAGLLSLLMFLSYLAAGAKGYPLCFSLTLLATFFFIAMIAADGGLGDFLSLAQSLREAAARKGRELRQRPARENLLDAAAFLFFLACFYYFWNKFWGGAIGNVIGGWDARYFWNMKARFYFRDPGAWRGMFSPLLADWGHPDYPLMLPGVVGWGWLTSRGEFLIVPFLVSLSFSLSLPLVIFWYLSTYVSFRSACVGTGFFFTVAMFHFWSSTQYADIPLSVFITGAAVLFVLAMRLQEKRLCLLAGLLTGLAVWTKDEGWFFSIWMFLTMAAVAWRSRRLEASFKTGMFLFFLLGWAAPALCSLYLKTCLGTTGGQYAGSGRSLSDFLFLLFGSPKKTQIIAAVFLLFAVDYKQWNGLWILFTAAAILGGRRGFSAYRAVYFALVLLMWSGYFVILHITPLDLRFQIETALLRIMSHASGLAVIFMMEAFARENQP